MLSFNPQRVLVTGGAGFIGSNFIHSFMGCNRAAGLSTWIC